MTILSVERVTLTIADTATTSTAVALSKGQDPAGCVPFSTHTSNSADADNVFDSTAYVEFFDDAGTPKVRAIRQGTASVLTIEVGVVEMSGGVQQISASITDTNASASVTVSSVTTTDTLYVYSYACPTNNGTWEATGIRFWPTSATAVTLRRSAITAGTVTGILYVVEAADLWTVEHGLIESTDWVQDGPGNKTDAVMAIGSVDLAKAFVIGSIDTLLADTKAYNNTVRLRLTDVDEITATIDWEVTARPELAFQVVELVDGLVQRGQLSYGSADTSPRTADVGTAVDLDTSVVHVPLSGPYSATAPTADAFAWTHTTLAFTLSDSNTVSAAKSVGAGQVSVSDFEVIQFTVSSGGGGGGPCGGVYSKPHMAWAMQKGF
jgi:hypothetical protein